MSAIAFLSTSARLGVYAIPNAYRFSFPDCFQSVHLMLSIALLLLGVLQVQVALTDATAVRALLRTKEVNVECKAQEMMNWPGFDMLMKPVATHDPGRCCARCRARHGCRAWLLRRETGECYLKEDVGFPIPCSDCVGGILDDDPHSGLTACRAMGRSCANRAAQTACQEVRNVCDVAAPKDALFEYRPNLESVPDLDTKDARVICKFLIREACKATVKEASENVDNECHRLVFVHGPNFSRDGCATKNQAKRMFRSLSEAVCDSMV